MIAMTIILCLLLWLGAGTLTLGWLSHKKELTINGPVHSVVILLVWPLYLIFTP